MTSHGIGMRGIVMSDTMTWLSRGDMAFGRRGLNQCAQNDTIGQNFRNQSIGWRKTDMMTITRITKVGMPPWLV
jgi:hypothetical protein